jgi:phosphatidylinositol alpha-1,6-mannosyltransferase
MSHLLVTNDYPPKLGGIQSYLYELWRRLPAEQVRVLTLDHPGARRFDEQAPHRIDRLRGRILLPSPSLRARICGAALEQGAGLVVLDPALPLGVLGPTLGFPYAVVLHGAEVAVPARLPGARDALRRVLGGARLIVAGGFYPEGEARRLAGNLDGRCVVIPPGVDTRRFVPLGPDARRAARRRHGLSEEGRLVLAVSRLVPRKGFDVLIEAAAEVSADRPDLVVAIGGEGRDRARLERLARRRRAPVRFLGRIEPDELPALMAAADVAAMLCRDRWLGLEQEGFGIVYLEAAAAGVASLAGRSGGSEDAVVDGVTGIVVDRPGDVRVAKEALARLLDDAPLRARLGAAGRARAVAKFDYDRLAHLLRVALQEVGG